jgi:hypothetical protein
MDLHFREFSNSSRHLLGRFVLTTSALFTQLSHDVSTRWETRTKAVRVPLFATASPLTDLHSIVKSSLR